VLSRQQLFERLHSAVRELLSTNWAPLFIQPGLAGPDFSFGDRSEVLEGLAWAYPHLTRELQHATKHYLSEDGLKNGLLGSESSSSMTTGRAREWFEVPAGGRARRSGEKPRHPFGKVSSIWRCAERCSEFDRVLPLWRNITNLYDDFKKSNWHLDAARGDLFANNYLASLLGLARLARWMGDPALAAEAEARANAAADTLAEWWRRAAVNGTLTSFRGSAELDRFIKEGDAISFAVKPHRHKLALFQDLTPEVAALVNARAPEAVAKVWETFSMLYPTWALAGEERQVHFGENFVDPPDLALNAFKALAWLRKGPSAELVQKIDLPFCRADLSYITKLALALEARE
jgi:hypothetical protein